MNHSKFLEKYNNDFVDNEEGALNTFITECGISSFDKFEMNKTYSIAIEQRVFKSMDDIKENRKSAQFQRFNMDNSKVVDILRIIDTILVSFYVPHTKVFYVVSYSLSENVMSICSETIVQQHFKTLYESYSGVSVTYSSPFNLTLASDNIYSKTLLFLNEFVECVKPELDEPEIYKYLFHKVEELDSGIEENYK